jgi:2-keto-4-pentenoate hydratase
MVSAVNLQDLADQLHAAEQDRIALDPLTVSHPDLSLTDAYRIQQLNVRRRENAGSRLRGYKIGLTSRAMQELFGVDQPDYGTLLDHMFVPDGGRIVAERLLQPMVEAEIAFELGADLEGPGLTAHDVLAATDAVRPALEVIDSRISDWRVRLADTIADNGSSGLVVLGAPSPPPDERALGLLGMVMRHNEAVLATAAGAAVLGGPAHCVAWLANSLETFGTRLRAGQVVLSGALHRAIRASAGDVFTASFAHLGAVSVSFGGARA